MTQQKIFIVTGLQRSGNHAVLDWVMSLFPDHAFYNNQRHDLFADTAALQAIVAGHDEAVIIFSFEDSTKHAPDPTLPLLDSVTPFPHALFPDHEIREFSILRDPYNTWASRVAANARADEGGKGLTSDPAWELYSRNWLMLAARHAADPDTVILFNAWKDDRAYREAVCARLGGTYDEATLEQVPTNATGSSFDGLPRPSYGQMLANPAKYVSGRFLKRLVSKPGHYLRRAITPPQTGSKLKVNERWKTLLDTAEGAPVFQSDEIRSESHRVFGFGLSPDGQKIA